MKIRPNRQETAFGAMTKFFSVTQDTSNTSGGTVLIGVQDRTGNVRGVADPVALEDRVAGLVADSISSQVLPGIEILRYSDRHVLAVRVYPGSSRPHYLGADPEPGACVRIGSTNRIDDEQLTEEMRRYANRESFDERPMPELDSEAIDFRAASESFAEFRRLTLRDLDILRLCATHQGRGTHGWRRALVRTGPPGGTVRQRRTA